MSLYKKFTLLLTLLVLFLSLFSLPAKAAITEGVPVNASNFFAAQLQDFSLLNFFHAGLCSLAGMSPAGKCIGLNKERDAVSAYLYDVTPGGGAIGGVTSATIALYNKPTSSSEYIASLGEDLGIAKSAYAQSVPGSGQSVVRPILSIWQVVRNLVYICYILVFLSAGFMIMFRQKLNAQTVVTIQSALPGLVLGLVLVTFSYLISSFIIDLSYVGVQLVAQVFAAAGNNSFGSGAPALTELAGKSSILELFWSGGFRPEDAGAIFTNAISLQYSSTGAGAIFTVLFGVLGGILGTFAFPGVGTVAGAGLGAVLGPAGAAGVVSLLVPLVFTIALLVQCFRLFIKLLKCYISLLVYTIIGPFMILMSSLPGRGGTLTNWWKTLLANALVFPAVFGTFLFAGFILATSSTGTCGGATATNLWCNTPPLFGGVGVDLVRILIAYAIILGTPAIPDMVKGAFGVKENSAIGDAATGAFLGAYGAASGFGKKAISPMSGRRGEYAKLAEQARFETDETKVLEQMDRMQSLRTGGADASAFRRGAARLTHLFQRSPESIRTRPPRP